MKKTINDFWTKVDRSNPNNCWNWLGARDRDGYGNCFQKIKPHRWIYQYYNGPITSDQFVCHSCDNPACVNPQHLWLGTLQDNHQDMMKKGRHGYGRFPGSQNKSAKLTEQQVLEIRALPGPNRLIAEKYGVSKCTIDEIRARKTWRHI